MNETTCTDCSLRFDWSQERCPHCGRPALFPNVRIAGDPREEKALGVRYRAAHADAAQRGVGKELDAVEAACGSETRAVIARDFLEVCLLARSEKILYSTYYKQIEAGVRLPSGEKWDVFRENADVALFGGYRSEVRFAVLSLDRTGLQTYGNSFLVLREDMIAHRASVLEENSVKLMERHQIAMSAAHDLPKGYRAVWKDRGRLCAVKLERRLTPGVDPGTFAALLLVQGRSTEDDDFVEVHIGGPMTVRTLKQVVVPRKLRRRALGRDLLARLEELGVSLEGREWTH